MIVEPKRRHYGIVIGIGLATVLGLVRGTQQNITTETDYIALLIAFAIIVVGFGFVGWLVDHFVHKFRSKKYDTQKQEFMANQEQTRQKIEAERRKVVEDDFNYDDA